MTTNYANLQNIAKYYLSQHTNIRKTAQHFGLSKSTVHNYLHKLKFVDLPMYRQVEIQAKINFDNKHIYGGIATRKKYKKSAKFTDFLFYIFFVFYKGNQPNNCQNHNQSHTTKSQWLPNWVFKFCPLGKQV